MMLRNSILPALREENANSSLCELRSEISEYLFRRNRFYEAGIKIAASTLNFFEPSLLSVGVRRTVQFLEKSPQQALFFRGWKRANLLFNI
jgi:hypothetical protein